MTPNGLTQAILEEVTELRFTDPQTRAADRALACRTDRKSRQGPPHPVGRLSRRRHAQCRNQLCGRRTGVEDGVSHRVAERRQQGGRKGAPAGLGGDRESHRRRLEGCRSDAGLRQSGGACASRSIPRCSQAARKCRSRPQRGSCRARTTCRNGLRRPRRPRAEQRPRLSPQPRLWVAGNKRRAITDPAQGRSPSTWSAPTRRRQRHRPMRQNRRGGIDATALSFPGKALARDRAHHDGAVHRPRNLGHAHLAVSARHRAEPSARGGAHQNDGDSALPAGLVTAFDVSADGSTEFRRRRAVAADAAGRHAACHLRARHQDRDPARGQGQREDRRSARR